MIGKNGSKNESERHLIDLNTIGKVSFAAVSPKKDSSVNSETYRLKIHLKGNDVEAWAVYLKSVKDFFKFLDVAKKIDLPLSFETSCP
jgi:hypothetical protein